MTISELSRENEKNEEEERKLSFLEIYASTVVVWIFFLWKVKSLLAFLSPYFREALCY